MKTHGLGSGDYRRGGRDDRDPAGTSGPTETSTGGAAGARIRRARSGKGARAARGSIRGQASTSVTRPSRRAEVSHGHRGSRMRQRRFRRLGAGCRDSPDFIDDNAAAVPPGASRTKPTAAWAAGIIKSHGEHATARNRIRASTKATRENPIAFLNRMAQRHSPMPTAGVDRRPTTMSLKLRRATPR